MLVELQKQLIPLDLQNLKQFAGLQRVRLQTLNATIADFEGRIEKVRKAAAPPPKDLSTQDRRVLGDIQVRQVNSAILALRRQADTALVEIIKALQQAARDAKTYGERHWDFWSVLRRAKTGAGDVAGIVEAMSLRASYAAVLENAGPLELSAWAQSAIDTADPILADAVLRENASRKADDRPFSSAALLSKLNNTEYKQASALLTEVIDIAEQGGIAYSGFMGRKDRQAFQRIQLGLQKMKRITGVSDLEENDILEEDADEGTPEEGRL